MSADMEQDSVARIQEASLSALSQCRLRDLAQAAFTFPAIDNHAHPLLSAEHKDDIPFEGLLSEAQGPAMYDAVHTLACYRATMQLSKLLGCGDDWEAVKQRRLEMPYEDLCNLNMRRSGIQCLLLDDLFDGDGLAESLQWHDRFTNETSKRIVRVETIAQDILKGLHKHVKDSPVSITTASTLLVYFLPQLEDRLLAFARDESVAAFKSVVCYRTGLDVSPGEAGPGALAEALRQALEDYNSSESGKLRLSRKALNDVVVHRTMAIAARFQKPVQFHTGLGDADITLSHSSPAHLQPLIKAYPDTPIVLLHASYPFTREAGYLASVYKNVYLDFGEVFPFVSADGQRAVVRQMLELCPTNKLLWSTDGHWWPETFYLGSIQSRLILYEVLEGYVLRKEMSEAQAVGVIHRALFENANQLYGLGLRPDRYTFGALRVG